MLWNFPIGEFAEYLQVANRSCKIQKYQKMPELSRIFDFSDLKLPRKIKFQSEIRSERTQKKSNLRSEIAHPRSIIQALFNISQPISDLKCRSEKIISDLN